MSESFRKQVQTYRRDAGYSQKQLAQVLGLNPSVLSHKLNESDGMRLTHPEIKQIVKALVTWQAIHTRSEAVELLELGGVPKGLITAEEWEQPPLNNLEGTIPTQPTIAPATGQVPLTNIPSPRTPLLGRQALLHQIVHQITPDDTRLLTLTGPGGVGKSRLAIEVGRQVATIFADGVVFVSLAQLHEPSLVPSAIVQALQLRVHAQSTPLETLKTFLPSRHLLLILDNYEHLLEATGVIGELLAVASYVKILVTSRAVLNLYGEYQIAVPPLPLPALQTLLTPERAIQEPAIALFVARTRAVRGDFAVTPENVQAIADICVRLDGLPLALELAAASSRLFAPKALLQRLNQRLPLLPGRAQDVSDRQKTLHDTISWSYDLLSEEEQQIFERLSIFPAGATVEAIEALIPTLDVPAGISTLLDKSLIYQKESKDQQVRFTMLETIREYAVAQIEAKNAMGKVRRQQIAYYENLVETLTPQLNSATQAQVLEQLEAEHDTLRAILSWSMKELPLAALRIGGALAYFWQLRGHAQEGYEWLYQALQIPLPANATTDEQSVYARALHGIGVLAYLLGEYERARYRLGEALTLRRTLQESKAIASTLKNLGNVYWDESHLHQAQELYQEALAFAHQAEDPDEIAGALNNLGSLLWQMDELPRAEKYLTEALTLLREIGNKSRTAMTLSNLGIVVLKLGELEHAGVYYLESLALFRELSDYQGLSATLNNMSELALHRGDYLQAQEYAEESVELRRHINYRWGVASAQLNLGSALLFQGEWGQALMALQEAQTIFRDLGDRAKLAIVLEYLGVTTLRIGDSHGALRYHREALALSRILEDKFGVASSIACIAAVFAVQGNFYEAARFWGAAYAFWAASSRTLLPAQQQRFLPELTTARTVSDPARFQQAWDEGVANTSTILASL
jgi:predicted ATPase/Tfp pilus assembly protein PilF/transcriptional regulator with XRE-family HTH domain